MTKRQRWLLTGFFALDLGYLLLRGLDATPYDDAYFFKRFALNFLGHGRFAWNLADGPVYGLTSQLFQAITALLTALAPSHFVLASKVFLCASLLVSVWLFAELAGRLAGRAPLASGVTLLALGNPLVAWSLLSGMETALALLAVTLSLRSILEPEPGRGQAWKSAALTVLVYLCRPDAALIPALTFVGSNLGHPRKLGRYAAVLAPLLGLCWLAFRLYYGTALPLPFYAKTLGLGAYDAALRALGARDKLQHLATFLAFAAPLLLLARPRDNPRAFALCVASVAFVGYHLVATSEIMGYRSRFYAPALIPLGLAAALGAPRALLLSRSWKLVQLGTWALLLLVGSGAGLVASTESGSWDRIAWPAYAAEVAIAAWLLLGGERPSTERLAVPALAVTLLFGTVAALPPRPIRPLSDRDLLRASSEEVTTTRGVFDVARCLPHAENVYHSEIGVPGLVLPETRIVDLVGLMSRSLALEHPPFDAYCLPDRPEAIFLPHKSYAELNREIAGSACLRDYTRVVRLSSSPLYVRNDLVAAFRGCAQDIQRWQ